MTAHLFHVNVNCGELETGVGFYRDTVGLSPLTRTTPTRPQPGDAFGLDEVQWDAWILTGDDGLGGVALDLLEWRTPPPHRPTEAGGGRRLRLVARAGALPRGATTDPDGTSVEIVAGPAPRVAGLVVGCADLEASAAFYGDVVGLERVDRSRFCDERGPDVFTVELVTAPRARPRAANDVGIYRLALITDTLDRDYHALLAAGVQPYSPPASLDMGPGLPGLRAVFFPDLDGFTLELIERPAAST